MSDNTHAAGQMQGYMLQVRHMLFELISLDNINVSIEKIGDVAIEASDGNLATDRSAAFWKTLYNWFNYSETSSEVKKIKALW